MIKTQKNITVTIVVLVIVLIIILIALYMTGMKNNEEDNDVTSNSNNNTEQNTQSSSNAFKENGEVNEEEEPVETIFSNEPFKVTNGAYFYTVENCIREYIDGIKKLQKEDNEENRQNLYGKLSENYVNKNNITLDNINNINIKDDSYLAGAVEMLQLNVIKNYIMRFSVKTLFLDGNNKMYNFNFIVYLDYANLTYAIEPVSGNNIELSKINLKSEIEDIDANDYNHYSYNVMTKDDIISKYIKFFKTLCYNVPEVAYSYLSDDCKVKTYPTVETFRNFVSNNQDKIKYLQIMSCDSMTKQDSETKYICSNVGGGYFTIYENTIMDFKIELNI